MAQPIISTSSRNTETASKDEAQPLLSNNNKEREATNNELKCNNNGGGENKEVKVLFPKIRRKRLFSEPSLDVVYDKDANEIAHMRLAPVDYNATSRVVKKFRKGYMNWRKGGARGARGEITGLSKKANSLHRDSISTNKSGESFAKLHDEVDFQQLSLDLLGDNSETQSGHTEHKNEEDGGHSVSFGEALFCSLNYNIGLAILSVPYAINGGGLVMVGFLLLGCFFSWHTAMILGSLLASNECIISYADIAFFYFPRKWARFGSYSIRLFQVLELFAYLVYGFESLQLTLSHMSSDHLHLKLTSAQVVVISTLVLLPLMLANSPRALAALNFSGIVSLIIVLFGLIFDMVHSHGTPSLVHPSRIKTFPDDFDTIAPLIGSTMLLFAGHAAFPSIYYSLDDFHVYKRVVNWTFFVVLTLSLLLGIVCSLAFGDSVQEIIVLSIRDPVCAAIMQGLLLVKILASSSGIITALAHEVEIALAYRVRPRQGSELSESLLEAGSSERRDRSGGFNAKEKMSSYLHAPLYGIEEMRFFLYKTHHDHDADDEDDPRNAYHSAPMNRSRFEQRMNLDWRTHKFNLERSPVLEAFSVRYHVPPERVPCVYRIFAEYSNMWIRIFVFILASLGASTVSKLTFIMALIGAIFSVQISTTFPGILAYFSTTGRHSPEKRKLQQQRQQLSQRQHRRYESNSEDERDGDDHHEHDDEVWMSRRSGIFYTVIGISIMVISLYGAIVML